MYSCRVGLAWDLFAKLKSDGKDSTMTNEMEFSSRATLDAFELSLSEFGELYQRLSQ
jgi:hypothetical protein